MERLFAPWRLEYVKGDKPKECVFCNLKGNNDLLLHETNLTTVILNKFPYNNGHLLISPKRHVADFEELTTDEHSDLFTLISSSISILKQALTPDGFNCGLNLGESAGAGIASHLHFHIVPRWNGDVNFMPILSETRVIPQHLTTTLELLTPFFKKL